MAGIHASPEGKSFNSTHTAGEVPYVNIKTEEVDGFNVIIFGSMGDGKSMMVNALTGGAQPGMNSGGCTKTVEYYAFRPEFAALLGIEKGCLWDTPGVGDVDASIGNVIGTVQDVVNRGVEFHAVILTVIAGMRIKPDSRLISRIINAAFVKNKKQIIVVMTQCDRLKDRERKKSFQNLYAEVQKMFDVENAGEEMKIKVVMTSIPNYDDGELGSDDEDFDPDQISLPNLCDANYDITQLSEVLRVMYEEYYHTQQTMEWGNPDVKGAITAQMRLMHSDLDPDLLQSKIDNMTSQIAAATQAQMEQMTLLRQEHAEQMTLLMEERNQEREMRERERELREQEREEHKIAMERSKQELHDNMQSLQQQSAEVLREFQKTSVENHQREVEAIRKQYENNAEEVDRIVAQMKEDARKKELRFKESEEQRLLQQKELLQDHYEEKNRTERAQREKAESAAEEAAIRAEEARKAAQEAANDWNMNMLTVPVTRTFTGITDAGRSVYDGAAGCIQS